MSSSRSKFLSLTFFTLLVVCPIFVWGKNEVVPSWIVGAAPSARCTGAKDQRPCKYTNGQTIANYPDGFPCPCSLGEAGGALPATGKVSAVNPDLGKFVDEIIVKSDPNDEVPFTNPVGMAFTDNTDELFIHTKGGVVFRVDLKTGTKNVWVDLTDEVQNAGDKGMVGLVAHPDFKNNPHLFMTLTKDPIFGQPDEPSQLPTYTRLIRLTSVNGKADPNSRVYIIGETVADGLITCHSSHVGGALAFGLDGTLLMTTGDGAHYDWDEGDYGQDKTEYDTQCTDLLGVDMDVGSFRSQIIGSINGKLLRMDPVNGDGICAGSGYDVLNPFCSESPGVGESKVWAMGFRNPFSLTVRPPMNGEKVTGPGVVYVGDVGFGSFEEVNAVVRSGMNFGWPCWEGGLPQPLYRDSVWDPLNCQNCSTTTIHRPVDPQTGKQVNCAYMYKEKTVDQPFYFWSRFTQGRGVKDLEYLGQGFQGNCVAGVAFYNGDLYPASYKNTVWFLDYGQRWIRMGHVDAQEKITGVQDIFKQIPNSILTLKTEPKTGNICYLRNLANQVRMISYLTGNRPPIVQANASPNTGKVPLTVQFSLDGTLDREGDALTQIKWDFGDGTPIVSGVANPYHVYTKKGKFEAKVTVSSAGVDTVQVVDVNVDDNAPPKVKITSPIESGGFFLFTKGQTITLDAKVEDEDMSSLTYTWEVQIVHNNHIHTDNVVINSPKVTANVDTFGAADHMNERANMRIVFTVTDKEGATTRDYIFMSDRDFEKVFGNSAPVPKLDIFGKQPFTAGQPITFNALNSTDADMDYLFYRWNFGDNLYSEESQTTHTFNYGGNYLVTLEVTDNWGYKAVTGRYLTVNNADGSAPTSGQPTTPIPSGSSLPGTGGVPYTTVIVTDTNQPTGSPNTGSNTDATSTENSSTGENTETVDVTEDTNNTDTNNSNTENSNTTGGQQTTTNNNSSNEETDTTPIPTEQEGSASSLAIQLPFLFLICVFAWF